MNFLLFSARSSILSVEGYIAFLTVFQFQSKILHSISQKSILLLSKNKATVYAKVTLKSIECMQAKQGT